MKLARVHIENFKGVKALDLDLAPGGDPSRLHCLLGDNGAGKTTVLQAIALTLSLATRRTRDSASFDWNGFIPERISSLGRTRVELEVVLDPDEVEATREAFRQWRDSRPPEYAQGRPAVEPSDLTRLTLVFADGHVECRQGEAARYQLLGRYYVKCLIKNRTDLRMLFARLGDVFWYDQYRNLGHFLPSAKDDEDAPAAAEAWAAGVGQLRETLVGWWAYHTSPVRSNGRDFMPEIENHFRGLFPGVVFRGVAPMADASRGGARNFYFLLERDGKVYDVAEMSSGEQAVFPVICNFVCLNVHRSIVLVDELEMHLHSPEQQALLSLLQRLGSDCQFLISTHSSFIEGSLLAGQKTRLEGGRLCL